jgi:hypothetical protein
MTITQTGLKAPLMLGLAALCALALTSYPICADPYTWGGVLTSSTLNYDSAPGVIEVLTYNPGPHPDLRTPPPGNVRFLFWPGETGYTGNGGLYNIGVQGYAFNTDLALTPSQFNLPAGWTATPNGSAPGLGRFSWVLKAPAPFFSAIGGFDISGVGNNVSSTDFVLPPAPDGANSSRAWAAIYIVAYSVPTNSNGGPEPASGAITDFWASASVPEAAPEPTSFYLGGFGLAGLAAWQALRRRTKLAP